MEIEEICTVVVDTAFKLHSDIGSGLLENAYEAILEAQLRSRGLQVERQVSIDIENMTASVYRRHFGSTYS